MLSTEGKNVGVLDGAIGAYQQAIEQLGLANDVVTFTASDFWPQPAFRRRRTDHAWGSNTMVFGGAVDGEKSRTYPD